MRVHRNCSVFFLLAGENSMRNLVGTLCYHILTFLKKERVVRGIKTFYGGVEKVIE
jgi:hypothetical protein